MAKYASNELFAGQQASVGRIVVVATAYAYGQTVLRAGVIASILGEDTPAIDVFGAINGEGRMVGVFVDAKSDAEIEAMPAGSWTWPRTTCPVEGTLHKHGATLVEKDGRVHRKSKVAK